MYDFLLAGGMVAKRLILGLLVAVAAGGGFYLGWHGLLIEAHTVRIRAPVPGDTTAWCRADCSYLTLRGVVTIPGQPEKVEDRRRNGSSCRRFMR